LFSPLNFRDTWLRRYFPNAFNNTTTRKDSRAAIHIVPIGGGFTIAPGAIQVLGWRIRLGLRNAAGFDHRSF
jgi:hypothetical protein